VLVFWCLDNYVLVWRYDVLLLTCFGFCWCWRVLVYCVDNYDMTALTLWYGSDCAGTCDCTTVLDCVDDCVFNIVNTVNDNTFISRQTSTQSYQHQHSHISTGIQSYQFTGTSAQSYQHGHQQFINTYQHSHINTIIPTQSNQCSHVNTV
jgi:hypothetical protein